MSDNNNDCPVEDFVSAFANTMLNLEFEKNIEDVEAEIEVTVGYESNHFNVAVDPGPTNIEWSLTVSEFVDDYLDEDEQKALFYYLRDELLSSDTLTPAEINVPLAEADEATTVPSLEPEEAPAASPATETVMASGIELRKQIESLLADEEAVAQVVMAMVNSGFAVSRVK